MLYRCLKTGDTVRLLAHGINATGDQLRGATKLVAVAIYCPADNEHTIVVRDLVEFEERFVPLASGELCI